MHIFIYKTNGVVTASTNLLLDDKFPSFKSQFVQGEIAQF